MFVFNPASRCSFASLCNLVQLKYTNRYISRRLRTVKNYLCIHTKPSSFSSVYFPVLADYSDWPTIPEVAVSVPWQQGGFIAADKSDVSSKIQKNVIRFRSKTRC